MGNVIPISHFFGLNTNNEDAKNNCNVNDLINQTDSDKSFSSSEEEIDKENLDNEEKNNYNETEDLNLLNSLSNEKNLSYNIQKLVNSFDLD